MVEDLPEQPEPAAQGTFEKTPFPHLLVYAYDRQLLGTMEFVGPTGETGTVLFIEGCPIKARTSEPVAYLGQVLQDLGMIDEATLNSSLRRLAEEKRLHGQILLEEGAITQDQLLQGLRMQLARKLQYVAHMPPETTFAYYEAFDPLAAYGGDEDATLDPYPLVWAAIREEPSWEHVHTALTKVGSFGLRIGPEGETDRFCFDPNEQTLIELLRTRTYRMHDLSAAGALSPRLTQLLVYCLLITKQVELVRESMVPAPPAPAPEPEPEPEPPSSRNPLPSEASAPAQAVARMKLQPLSVKKNNRPAAVEEKAVGLPWDRRLTPPSGMAATAQPVPAAPRPPPAEIEPRTVPRASPVEIEPRTVPNQAIVPSAPIAKPIAPGPPVALPFAPEPPKPQPAAPVVRPAATPAASPVSPRPPTAGPPVSVRSPNPAPAASPRPPAEAPAPPKLTVEMATRRAEIVERAAVIESQNYFEMLGLARDSTPEQATTAFFTLAKLWHPDRVPAPLADVKDECAKIFAHMSEAHQTLLDKDKRSKYMTLLRDGGATPESQDQIIRVLEAATNFQKAEICMKRNDLVQAEDFCKKAIDADPGQAEYQALHAWLDALKPANQSPSMSEEIIKRLTKALTINANCERAYFYRGMLQKRLQHEAAAVKDFRKAYELNPRNIDAQREVRLAEMRGGPGSAAAGKKKKGEEEKGGLLGKLFKK